MDNGFARAQADYDAMLPPEPPPLTHVDVTFTVRLGLEEDLSGFDGRDALEQSLRRFIEGCVSVSGHYGADRRLPLPTDDVEIYDFRIEATP